MVPFSARASYLGLEIYAAFWTGQSQASLARFRTWIDSHTDQLIIVGSLILGFWLIGKSIYLIVSWEHAMAAGLVSTWWQYLLLFLADETRPGLGPPDDHGACPEPVTG